MKKILIIEDEKDIRDTVKDILEMKNYKVVAAADGNEGFIMALKEKPDLIISDVLMPGFNGFQLLEHLSKSNEVEHIPVILLTAKTQADDFRQGLMLGAADYLTKPFKTKELLDSIENQFNKIEQQKQREINYFVLAFENPFSGVFYMLNERIVKINKAFTDITEYSLLDLQNTGFESLFSFNAEAVQQEINECMQGLKEKGNIKSIILSKSKTAKEVELFIKKINTENAVLGIIHPIQSNENFQNDLSAEISELVDYFKNQENAFIVNEIISALKHLNIEKSVETDNIKSKIKLSPRELEVLEYICKGFTNQEIADKLFLSARTVDNHRAKILEKTNTRNTAELVGFAVKNSIVKLE